jgi:hypothetical protein
MDERVEAVRNHPKVGRGSCSWIDECLTDQDLAEELDQAGATSAAAAVRWAVEGHDLWVMQMQEVRAAGGADDWL